MDALRRYRKALNLTQAQLARMVGVATSTITQYEIGTRKPNIYMLKKLATIFNCSTDELLEPIEI